MSISRSGVIAGVLALLTVVGLMFAAYGLLVLRDGRLVDRQAEQRADELADSAQVRSCRLVEAGLGDTLTSFPERYDRIARSGSYNPDAVSATIDRLTSGLGAAALVRGLPEAYYERLRSALEGVDLARTQIVTIDGFPSVAVAGRMERDFAAVLEACA